MEDYELSKQLTELTNWQGPFDTDYLLTKLPAYHEYWNGGNESGYFHLDKYNRDWVAGYTGLDENNAMQAFTFSALTPKTALLKLAIELAKAGVIGKEGE